MRYLTVDDVVLANVKALGDHETHGVQNFGLLESAVMRPQTTINGQDAYPDIYAKAAVLFYSLVNNHPFATGNKRTAVLAMVLYLNLNGMVVTASDIDVYHLALDTATKVIDTDEIASQLKDWTSPQTEPPLE